MPPPVKTAPKAALKLGSCVQLSHEQPIEQSLRINLFGKPKSGKTYMAHTISKYAPEGDWPKERKSGKVSPIILADGASLSFDDGACKGFRERGFSVPEFDVQHFMAAGWKKTHFKREPTIHEACDFGINELMQHGPTYLAVDTVSTFDVELNEHWSQNAPKSTQTGEEITIQKFGGIKADHAEFVKSLRGLDLVLIMLFHSTVKMDVTGKAKAEAKAKKDTMMIAGGGLIEPAVTGGAASYYKAIASLQLAVIAVPKNVGGKAALERYVAPAMSDDYETKNRWELSLDMKEPPHLGKILKKLAA